MLLCQERVKAEVLNRKLRGQLADYRVPPVLQYITAKASHNQLEHIVRAWERKVEISEVRIQYILLEYHTTAFFFISHFPDSIAKYGMVLAILSGR